MIIPSDLQPVSGWSVSLVLLAAYVLYKFARSYATRGPATPLAGPARTSWLFGAADVIRNAPNASNLYEVWADKYGSVFRVPAPLGGTRVVLTDPKAIAHFYTHETFTYVQTKLARVAIENLFGRGLLWAEGESHKRQRKAISPAFSNVAIRRMTSIFYDSVYKLRTNWDNQLASVDSAMIDVQKWMNHVSLDSVGIAGFSHDFGSLEGKHSAVADVFDRMGHIKPSPITAAAFFFGNTFPFLWRIPTPMRRLQMQLNRSMEEIATVLLENTRREMQGTAEKGHEDKSIIGLLNESSHLGRLRDHIEHQEKQVRLREELKEQFPTSDPTWEQLTNGSGLHYLDAVVHEILRLHPPLAAAKDDVIPLSQPLRLPNGELTDHVAVRAGQHMTVPIGAINVSAAFWGADAREFRPERWLADDGIPKKAQEVQGHRHLLTFVDGPRMCLGRGFALAEFKAVLGVLIKNYTFELPNGPETTIESVRGVLPRPRVAGEEGACVPMRVRRVDG
ncbi:11-oxo-beta-amyrin 30-oxidase [Trametes pubescens]|uniref:11-oxo-beta-amyrin 30-oxidase n=1 Tax=Trametes pubescens TaxID=154538 RepID=A0A1M2V487_TRAPU|nr:11-oxo-beta-amyrin 30-oxidase [Trametes pubescens]